MDAPKVLKRFMSKYLMVIFNLMSYHTMKQVCTQIGIREWVWSFFSYKKVHKSTFILNNNLSIQIYMSMCRFTGNISIDHRNLHTFRTYFEFQFTFWRWGICSRIKKWFEHFFPRMYVCNKWWWWLMKCII